MFEYGSSGGGGTTGGISRILETTLGAPAPTISFTVPGGYRDLILQVWGRTTSAAASYIDILMQFNADTAAHYDYQEQAGANGTGVTTAPLAQTGIRIGWLPTNGSAAGEVGLIEATVAQYLSTTFNKAARAHGGAASATATANVSGVFNGQWRNTAAITSLLVLPSDASNFAIGTIATLYGRS